MRRSKQPRRRLKLDPVESFPTMLEQSLVNAIGARQNKLCVLAEGGAHHREHEPGVVSTGALVKAAWHPLELGRRHLFRALLRFSWCLGRVVRAIGRDREEELESVAPCGSAAEPQKGM